MSYLRTTLLGSLSSLLLCATPVDLKIFDDLPLLHQPSFSLTSAEDIGSLYMIKGAIFQNYERHPMTFFVTKDKSTLILGNAFDTKSGRPLTYPFDSKRLEHLAPIVYGEGKQHYFVFTDPECPYCKQFEALLPKLSKMGTFYIFLYPLAHHPQALPMSYWLLSLKAQERPQALISLATGSTTYKDAKFSDKQKKEFNEQLRLMKELGDDVNLQGTPAVFTTTGEEINWKDLEQQTY